MCLRFEPLGDYRFLRWMRDRLVVSRRMNFKKYVGMKSDVTL